MQTDPITIPQIAGPIQTSGGMWTGKTSVTVNGVAVAATGRRTFALPTVDGRTVTATVSKVTTIKPFPVITIDGVAYPTGVNPPLFVGILAMLPLMAIAIAGPIFGGIIGVGAFAGNLNLLRKVTNRNTLVLALAGIGCAALLLSVVVSIALLAALR